MARKARAGELMLVGGEKSQMRKASNRDWSKAKEQGFLSVLAETCNVTCAAAEAGVSVSAAYRRRKVDAGFRAAWLEAIGLAYQRLELVLLERAFAGTEKIVRRKDGSEERMVEYPNQLALTLLKMHRDTAPLKDRIRIINAMSPIDLLKLDARFEPWAHEGQLPPEGEGWRVWLMMAGRGFGKTRAGAEWVHALANAKRGVRIALVGATMHEARSIMVEGVSGLLRVAKLNGERLVWEPSLGKLRWRNGSEAQLFSGENPDGCGDRNMISPGPTSSPNGRSRRTRGAICRWVFGAGRGRGL